MESYTKIVLLSSIVFYKITKSLGEDFYAFNKSSIPMEICNYEFDEYDGYECSDGTCIKETQYCNGIVDCAGTAEDEINCKKCPTGLCAYHRSGLCDTFWLFLPDSRYDDPISFPVTLCDLTMVKIDCSGKAMVSLPCFSSYNFHYRELKLNGNLFGLFDSLSDSTFQEMDQISVLQLESNQIKYLPSKVFQYCKALKELSLANNQIQQMDDTAFQHLYNLTILRLNGNYIRNLTSNVFQDLINVSDLYLSRNVIGHLDENVFGNLSRLKILDLDRNNITTLPPNVFQKLNNLTTLRLSNNRIAYLNGDILRDLRNLTTLYLEGNVIANLSQDAFQNLQNLEALYLRDNQIVNLHETTFHHLPKLESLYLERNKIQRLPADVFRNLTNLQVLNLSKNQIQKLDEFVFANLRNLTRLRLGGNRIGDLPPKVFHDLENLEWLELHNNQISNLDEIVFQNVPSLGWLDLQRNYISDLPVLVFQNLTNLIELLLNKNQIKYMDEMVFQNLHLLTTLDLQENHISYLSAQVFQSLISLEKLFLNNNRINSTDEMVFQNLTNLIELNLAANSISNLPEKIFNNLTNLRSLSLDENQIQHLDEAIFQSLHILETLSIRGNSITHLPANVFKNLKNLRKLNLGNNAIQHLPNVLFENQLNLRILNMNNNRLISLPADMLKRCRLLQSLNLEGNAIENVDEFSFSGLSHLLQLYLQNNTIGDVNDQIFRGMKKLELLVVDEYRFCCLRKDVKDCRAPIDDFSSCEDLMKNTILRIFVWIIGIIAICANIFVIVVRIKYQNARTNKVNLFLIVNLAISDLIMGVYLIIIATIDEIYRGEYYLHDLSWRRSYLCDFVGVLSTFSSELTVFILTVVSIDRLLSVMFPWRTIEGGLGRTKILIITVWILAAVISLVPHQIFQIPYFKNFYGRSGVCLALHITEDKPNGWQYSVSIFILLNALSFAVIAVAYAIMYYRASGKFRKTITSSNRSSDTVMAFRMTLLVLADAACWIPIIVFGVRSLMGYALSPDAYAWIAVFVLPLNAALNPIIYTISSIPLVVDWKFEKCPDNSRSRLILSWRGVELQSIQR